jgi:hypothetical protein
MAGCQEARDLQGGGAHAFPFGKGRGRFGAMAWREEAGPGACSLARQGPAQGNLSGRGDGGLFQRKQAALHQTLPTQTRPSQKAAVTLTAPEGINRLASSTRLRWRAGRRVCAVFRSADILVRSWKHRPRRKGRAVNRPPIKPPRPPSAARNPTLWNATTQSIRICSFTSVGKAFAARSNASMLSLKA